MNLINDLGNELAISVLIEKRHSEKMSSKDVLPLINRINEAAQPVSYDEGSNKAGDSAAKAAKNSTA